MTNYKTKKNQLVPLPVFYKRVLRNLLIAIFIIAFSLFAGVWGYMGLGHLHFVDALLNASMILSGMGPVDILTNDSAKYFASFYALFSGITFLTTSGIIIAPILHRLLHKFHIDDEERMTE